MNTYKADRGMTRQELLALPVAVDLDTANRALTIGRSTGYALAKRGQYPVTVPSSATPTAWSLRNCTSSSV